jgi:hypothetical protein
MRQSRRSSDEAARSVPFLSEPPAFHLKCRRIFPETSGKRVLGKLQTSAIIFTRGIYRMNTIRISAFAAAVLITVFLFGFVGA